DVLGNVGGMVGDAFQMSGGENKLHSRTDKSCLLRHALHELVEDAVTILIDDVVALKDLACHFDVAKDQRAETLADHGAYGRRHGGEFFRQWCAGHFAERNDALREIHGEVADALQIIRNFEGGNDQAHLVVRKRAAAEQPYGVFVDDNFHFIDAGLEQKNFTGKS